MRAVSTFQLMIAFSVFLASCAGTANAQPRSATVVTITTQEMQFSVNSLTVKAGQPITLVLENAGALEHSLFIDELGVAIAHIQPGQRGEATFTPETPGTYAFYCNAPGHRQANMTGQLIVEP